MTSGIYVHIPFCRSKCRYCSFVSFPLLKYKEQYLVALEKQIKYGYKGEIAETLYFGGGTPSLLDIKEFEHLIGLFNINSKTELTVELNPNDVTYDYLCGLKFAGVNRISFGCQSFDDKILKKIGRRHCANDVFNAVRYAKSAGIENINLDLIYGLPNQSLDGFTNDLNLVVELAPSHVSLYGLNIEKGCYFYKNPPKNIANEDLQADMYLKAIEILTERGYKQYEISNFAKDGKISRHNLNYWNNGSYYGFGVASHGYEHGIRYFNTSNLRKYLSCPTKHEGSHKLTKQEKLEEEIFLGFRKSEGIDIEKINKNYSIDFLSKYKNVLQKYSSYLEETEKGFKLTKNGILVSNVILANFLEK